jgi:pyruvate/2-oxoglutarate dehydrogenase complex dihydrolipoamide dehydrogenase (E3) component
MGESTTDEFELLVIGSGEAGKYLAWTMASAGHRTAMVERSLIGGSCPNIACLPSKNVIHSAKVASFAGRAGEFGLDGPPLTTNMKGVRRRKREMVDRLVELHLGKYNSSGTNLIMGNARLVGAMTVEVQRNDGGRLLISAEKIFLNLGSRALIPAIPGLAAAAPMTHIESL